MNFIWTRLTEWLTELLVSSIMGNLTGLFDGINDKVSEIAANVGSTPQAWNSGVFSMVQNLSETVMVPIAGVILTFVMTIELIQMIIDRNNLHDFETFMFYKWIFKTFAAVLIVTNTWNIVMAVFDVAQSVVSSAAGVIIADTSIDLNAIIVDEKDKAIPNWENVPKDFSAGTVNNEWAFAVTLVDADGNEMEDMCKGYATGVIGVGANVAMYEYNLQVNNENGHPTPELPEQLYLAVVADDGTIDMTTAVQVL